MKSPRGYTTENGKPRVCSSIVDFGVPLVSISKYLANTLDKVATRKKKRARKREVELERERERDLTICVVRIRRG